MILGWDRIAGKLVSTTLLLLHRALSADSSSVTLIDVHCFHAFWIETILQLFNVFYASKDCLNFIKIELTFLCFLTFYIFITSVS